ncbi:MAG: hypothetical protein ACI835_004243 [Planctomycetota bacterium]|jgi:hypothetical protein
MSAKQGQDVLAFLEIVVAEAAVASKSPSLIALDPLWVNAEADTLGPYTLAKYKASAECCTCLAVQLESSGSKLHPKGGPSRKSVGRRA